MRYLLDTDWAISYLNDHPGTVRYLDTLRPEGIAISIVSLAELYEGPTNSSDPDTQRKGVDRFPGAIPDH